eukprot:2833503-Rhodomonas_salina.1
MFFCISAALAGFLRNSILHPHSSSLLFSSRGAPHIAPLQSLRSAPYAVASGRVDVFASGVQPHYFFEGMELHHLLK